MAGYKQPIPSWRQRQIHNNRADADAAFQENVVGPITGLDVEAAKMADSFMRNELPGDDAAGAQLPIAQTEHHSIGKQFILAGNAVFTIAGREHRYTFRIAQPKDEGTGGQADRPKPYFVSVLTGGGEHKYTYIGVLNVGTGQVHTTRASKIGLNTPAAKALQWTLNRVWRGLDLPAPAACYHEGRCGRCGRPLTDPASILRGFGPDCADILGIE